MTDSGYRCPARALGHFVTGDNPMATGRCACCRAFVALFPRLGWRRATMRQARASGALGARRTDRER